MDVVTGIRDNLKNWRTGGEAECRNTLIHPHSTPTDPSSADLLLTAYHTLVSATLPSFSPQPALTPGELAAFVEGLLQSLPSSSSSSEKSAQAVTFGELLVDLLWTVDAAWNEISPEKDEKRKKEEGQEKDENQEREESLRKDREALAELVKEFLARGIIDPHLCRERLDSNTLERAGLVVSKATFNTKEVRVRTGLFYKQNKFNLLREQSEGYSKLTTELTSSIGPAHSPATGRPVESWQEIAARAQPVWEHVVSLIGYFDLDPNRALDIILDVFSVHIETHYSFFLTLLSFSAWSCVECKPREEDAKMDTDGGDGGGQEGAKKEEPAESEFKGKSLDEVLMIAESKTQPIFEPTAAASRRSKSRVMAQVLGFKFRYYRSPGAEEPKRNLYLMAALLIREGFITLEELYPHICPEKEEEDDMDKAYKEYLASINSRIDAAKLSQLALAAPLESSNTPSSSKPRPAAPAEAKKAPEPKSTAEQKARLLEALLAVGALRPALSILSSYPWLVDAHTEIADLLIRVLTESIEPLHKSISRQLNPSFRQSSMRYSKEAGRVVQPPPRTFKITLWAPTPPPTYQTEFVYFFPYWTERVPVAQTLEDLADVVEPLLAFVRVHVSRDASFMTKIVRLGRHHIATTVEVDPTTKKPIGQPDGEHPIVKFWFKIARLYVLPALPLVRGNAVLAVDVWTLLRNFETTMRWQLYGEWRTKTYGSHPELRVRRVQADRESKAILRRLSHNTIDTLSGNVAKLAHSNPCIFFANAVNQIMAYENLANVVIQVLRYVTNLGFDVLVFLILDAFANPNKARVKDDGVNTADWLTSLASFTGMLFRRYSADLTSLLKYIVNQLFNGEVTDTIVLRELIWRMAGIEPLPNLNESQIIAMAGGPLLRIEAVASTTRGARQDPGDAALKGPVRLARALLDSGLALPLLIQVAQLRQSCVFTGKDTHLKALAGLFDATHGVFLQYLELLSSPSVIEAHEYEKLIPALAELAQTYGIRVPVCMQIIRPILHKKLLAAALEMQEKEQEKERLASEEQERRLKAALTAKREPTSATSRVASPAVGETAASVDSPEDGKPSVSASKSDDATMENMDVAPGMTTNEPWIPELRLLFDDVRKVLPREASQVIGPAFYLTFWQLSTYDLSPPGIRYEEEVNTLRSLARQEENKQNAAQRSSDKARRSMQGLHKSKHERYNDFANKLTQELKEQTASRAFTLKRLAREKQYWFAHSRTAGALAAAFIEYCLLPRCLLSPMDADYSAQIIKVIHNMGTPGFSTLMVYDKLLGDHVGAVLFSCSEYEARNYGRFLLGLLTDTLKWYQDEQLFNQENRSKAGGKTVLLPGMQYRWSYKATISQDDLMKFPDWQKVVKKWHRKIGNSLRACIKTGEFMHVYNAIVVLKELLPVFPLAAVVPTAGHELDKCMREFLQKEERGDLKILGRAYHASLQKRESLWAVPELKDAQSTSALARPPVSQTDHTRTTGPPNGAEAGASNARAGAPQTTAPIAPRAQLAGVNGVTHGPGDKSNAGSGSTRSALDSIPRPEVVKRIRPESRNGDTASAPDRPSSLPNKLEAMDVDSSPGRADNVPSGPKPSDAPPQAFETYRDPPPLLTQGLLILMQIETGLMKTALMLKRNPLCLLRLCQVRPFQLRNSVRRHDKPLHQGLLLRRTTRRCHPRVLDGGRRRPQLDLVLGHRASRVAEVGVGLGQRRGGRMTGDPRGMLGGTPGSRRPQIVVTLEIAVRETEMPTAKEIKTGVVTGMVRETEIMAVIENGSVIRNATAIEIAASATGTETGTETEKGIVTEGITKIGNAILGKTVDPRVLLVPLALMIMGYPRGQIRQDIVLQAMMILVEGGALTKMTPTEAPSERREGKGVTPIATTEHGVHLTRMVMIEQETLIGVEKIATASTVTTEAIDKRVPEGPSTKALPPTTPSAPRAMASADISRSSKSDPLRERDRRPSRDSGPHLSQGTPPAGRPPEPVGGSLRARISDKEGSRSSGQSSELPYRVETDRTRADSTRDNDRDAGRKRTLSEREREGNEAPVSGPPEQQGQPPKRPRVVQINRNRYGQSTQSSSASALARKGLPIDPARTDKPRGGRDD
ncbi:hypothetical protein GLOTRDRAFT_136479 [Gloeophyllum trabeum ATCC 11539]|uniref:THO complex subunit 2 n=1 Tax=Gloeophyllum trabeum (strain ATCC 11539 / FP-39264 / Madison 617) TaxID=670483 RepID=S7QJ30_GLOTA|nr:uncharacterized protein GLOTRDRAFT_136479 [Gloeophyllum trabeum ATCC 11539]EPQ59661.1 hypothetical protein GLOTRDRAFT_136479 [Gloeophyllum trabeum ATCC 11539]